MLVISRLRELIQDYERRTGRRLSISQLARDTGLAQSTLHNLLNNETQRFDGPVIAVLCSYFNVPIEKLLVYEPSNEPTYHPPETIEEALERLERRYTEVIDELPAQFTSDDFILALAESNQRDYANLVAFHIDVEQAFERAHAALIERLHRFSNLIEIAEHSVASQNLFRQASRAYLWRKVR